MPCQIMRWDQLLCDERQGHEQHPGEKQRNRNQFERDFDRIIFSEAFRRDTVLKNLIEEGLNEASFGVLVQAACLAHDIGNPPFGHSGENAIQSWFYSELGQQHLGPMSDGKKENLEWFEGNAQGFRILTKSERQVGRKSLQITFATLATFTKYPRESLIKDRESLKVKKRESVSVSV